MTERKIEALKFGDQTIYVEVTEIQQVQGNRILIHLTTNA